MTNHMDQFLLGLYYDLLDPIYKKSLLCIKMRDFVPGVRNDGATSIYAYKIFQYNIVFVRSHILNKE